MQLTRNFQLSEFGGAPQRYFLNVMMLAHNLQVLRDYLGVAIHVHSGYRTVTQNAKVGGADNSQHLTASAADIWSPGAEQQDLYDAVEHLIGCGKMRQGGLGRVGNNSIHYDIRGTKARW